MTTDPETAALVALLRSTHRPWRHHLAGVEDARSALPLLLDELGLLAEVAMAQASEELEAWGRRGIQVLSLLDPRFPRDLRRSEVRPPLLFVAGDDAALDTGQVAVVGTRRPTANGLRLTRSIARRLARDGWTLVSGMAAGIDTAAHEAALSCGGRTVAVVGTGLDHCYPKQNAALQRRIIGSGAVVSQFWPEVGPSRRTFPMRNGVMAGLTSATVITEASALSGTRIQARLALAEGRMVLLHESLLVQAWAREMSEQSGVSVVGSAAELSARLGALRLPELAA